MHPHGGAKMKLPTPGFEPGTSASTARRSNQLSYVGSSSQNNARSLFVQAYRRLFRDERRGARGCISGAPSMRTRIVGAVMG